MELMSRCALLLLCAACACADSVDGAHRYGVMMKYLREMVNQTKGDTLNLPANATSIRENITDTFSCDNRTYGYYADVDNECQVFHVCLTSESSSGHNTTYRWSFICPNETIFNQEVLTCTRPRDSIDCQDSPMYYHVNMEIGKIPNDTQTSDSDNNNMNSNTNNGNPKAERIKDKRKVINRKKPNIIAHKMKENLQAIDFGKVDVKEGLVPVIYEERPQVHEVGEFYEMGGETMENSRIGLEKSLKKGRKIRRGSFRFKADV